MLAYVIRRVADGLVTVIGVLFLLFVLFFTMTAPDDVARKALGENARQEQIDQWKRLHGYDRPLLPGPGHPPARCLLRRQTGGLGAPRLGGKGNGRNEATRPPCAEPFGCRGSAAGTARGPASSARRSHGSNLSSSDCGPATRGSPRGGAVVSWSARELALLSREVSGGRGADGTAPLGVTRPGPTCLPAKPPWVRPDHDPHERRSCVHAAILAGVDGK